MAKQESSEGQTTFSPENTEEERDLARKLVMKQAGAEDLLDVLELA
jgi:hypothetical protein